MPKPFRHTPILLILIAFVLLTGCGGSKSLVHFEGSSANISKETLGHWMKMTVGGDFRTSVLTRAPEGLVSEPADFPRCAKAVRVVVPEAGNGKLKLSDAEINRTCHELYRSVKAQALSFLISAQWTIAEGAEQGVKVSGAEVGREFARFRKSLYPTRQQLQKYLAERHLSLSDVLYQLKRSMLVRRLLPKFEETLDGADKQVLARLNAERLKSLILRTTCSPDYAVPDCSNYHGPRRISPTPAQILVHIAQAGAG